MLFLELFAFVLKYFLVMLSTSFYSLAFCLMNQEFLVLPTSFLDLLHKLIEQVSINKALSLRILLKGSYKKLQDIDVNFRVSVPSFLTAQCDWTLVRKYLPCSASSRTRRRLGLVSRPVWGTVDLRLVQAVLRFIIWVTSQMHIFLAQLVPIIFKLLLSSIWLRLRAESKPLPLGLR